MTQLADYTLAVRAPTPRFDSRGLRKAPVLHCGRKARLVYTRDMDSTPDSTPDYFYYQLHQNCPMEIVIHMLQHFAASGTASEAAKGGDSSGDILIFLSCCKTYFQKLRNAIIILRSSLLKGLNTDHPKDLAVYLQGAMSPVLAICPRDVLSISLWKCDSEKFKDFTLRLFVTTDLCAWKKIEEKDEKVATMLSALLSALIGVGADMKKPNKSGWTPLMQCTYKGNYLCCRALIEAKADLEKQMITGFTALTLSAYNGHNQCLQALIEAKADLEKQNGGGGNTALMLSSQFGYDQCVRTLIEAGANVDHTDKGYTSLMKACMKGYVLCARALIEARADVEKAEADGQTALMCACRGKDDLCVLALIEAKADLEKQNGGGNTALMLSCQFGKDHCVRALMEAKADPDKQTATGFTALMFSAINDFSGQCAHTLVETKADLEKQDQLGMTALLWACAEHNEDCVDVLIKAGAAVDAVDNKQWTALMFCALNGGNDQCARALIEAGTSSACA